MSREADKMRAHEEHRQMWRKARASEKKPSARSIVLKKYPEAFGWREFTVSDYVVKTEPGGRVLGHAHAAKDAWEIAAKNSVDRTAKP